MTGDARSGSYEFEDDLLTRIALEAALAPLPECDRVMLLLVFRIECPRDYTGRWPPTYASIGTYIGLRYEGVPLSESAIRYREAALLRWLRGERGPLRRLPGPDDIERDGIGA